MRQNCLTQQVSNYMYDVEMFILHFQSNEKNPSHTCLFETNKYAWILFYRF